MRTRYVIDDFQQIYFVIESFEKLLEDCYRDFDPVYERLATAQDIEPHQIVAGDILI
jgi:phenylalanine-4-hydroxylase